MIVAAKLRRKLWFNLLFTSACFFVFAYPVVRISTWLDAGIGWAGAIVLWASGMVGMVYAFKTPKMVLRYIMVHWMGLSFVFASLVLLVEILRWIVPLNDEILAQSVIICASILCLIAVLFSHNLRVKRYRIASKKITRAWRIVQISDVHIGSRQGGFMQRIVRRINQLEPDFITITGDLIDSTSVQLAALESLSKLKAKTFFSIGNHERYADLDKMLAMAEQLGLHTLRQQSVSMREITFLGIDDADRRDQVDCHLPNIALSADKFNVLLYHRPLGWECAIKHGVDLMLSGHTHNGQIFPFNWIVKQQFPRICGLYREGYHHLHVSPGTGTWGPLMRLGSCNEITVLTIEPE